MRQRAGHHRKHVDDGGELASIELIEELCACCFSGCLTLMYEHECWFGRILRIAVGLSLPWIVAPLLPAKRQEEGHRPWHQSYWFRVALSYLGVVVLGIVEVLIWPFVMMDSGIM
jgi:hypothetical protein